MSSDSESEGASTTVLVISGVGVSPYSARGLTQTLQPIDQSQNTHRTVNGNLRDVSSTQFRKYKSTISGSDQNVPPFDGLFPGAEVTVDCISSLSYRTDGGSPTRIVASSYIEGEFTIYRPRLDMMVMNTQTQEDEYGAVISWSIDLEEV